MNNSVLLLGSSGQVGFHLQDQLSVLGEVEAPGRETLNLLDTDSHDLLRKIIDAIRPRLIVNAAAYTAVDQAESERENAVKLNCDLPGQLAALARQYDAILVDYSTDYVFAGTGTDPYQENDPTSPVNYYGRTKLDGLNRIQAAGCRYLVFRVSWVYSARRHNFLKTILRLAAERDSLNVIDDQQGTPTEANWIAQSTVQCLEQALDDPQLDGVYHLGPSGETTWNGFAREIVRQANQLGFDLKLDENDIAPITTAEYPTPAQRPLNSKMSKQKIESNFGLNLPPWQDSVTPVLEQLLKEKNRNHEVA